LLFDTLIVRSFMTPSIAALLGRWFWWPRLPGRPGRRAGMPQLPPDDSANWATRRVGSNLSA
jgi:RND superfamily putative drug exporter